MSTDAAPLPNPTALPDDLSLCQQMIRELLASLHSKDRELEQVRHRLDQLLRRLYGPRAERIDPSQLLLFAELAAPPPAPPATPPPEPAPAAPPAKPGHGRQTLPRELPRIRQVHDLSPAERACPGCGHERVRISVETSEQLDYHPASVHVVVHERPVYACLLCEEQVSVAAKPAQPIDKGLPGPGLLAHVITSKYADHLPLHRQERILARQGVSLSRSTLCDWMAAAARLLTPLYNQMVSQVRQSPVIWTDDTPVPVRDEKRETLRQGRLWVYLGDREHPFAVFDYTPTHARDGPVKFLAGFEGYLQADAFSGYDRIYTGSDGRIREVACWAHARRKFYEARLSAPAPAYAALAWIRRLYDVEDQAKALGDAERAAYRQAHARPLLAEFGAWLAEQAREALPKSPLGQAIAYTLANWEALGRYPEAGFLTIDNNLSERTLRAIAIGRKNWLHLGSDTGGRTAAILFSFAATCRRHELDPFAYLRDVLTRLPTHPTEQLAELMPGRWIPATSPPAPHSPTTPS